MLTIDKNITKVVKLLLFQKLAGHLTSGQVAGITIGVLVMVTFVSVMAVAVRYFYKNGDLKFRVTKSQSDYHTHSLDQMSVTSVTSSERPCHNLQWNGSTQQRDEQMPAANIAKVKQSEERKFQNKNESTSVNVNISFDQYATP